MCRLPLSIAIFSTLLTLFQVPLLNNHPRLSAFSGPASVKTSTHVGFQHFSVLLPIVTTNLVVWDKKARLGVAKFPVELFEAKDTQVSGLPGYLLQ